MLTGSAQAQGTVPPSGQLNKTDVFIYDIRTSNQIFVEHQTFKQLLDKFKKKYEDEKLISLEWKKKYDYSESIVFEKNIYIESQKELATKKEQEFKTELKTEKRKSTKAKIVAVAAIVTGALIAVSK